MIVFNNVTKKYNKEVALANINFEVKEKEFVFITGVSGSGKTTLLKLMYKAELPTNGEVFIFGKDMKKVKAKKIRRKMGIVFQNYELLSNKTVYENVAYPLECLGVNPFKVKKETFKALEMLHIEELAKKKPEELSGGQQQRVAIARAIVNKPLILICDEPTGNLDSENTRIIMGHLQKLNESGTTIIMSTHNEELIKEMDKRVINIESGHIIDDGITKEVEELPLTKEKEILQKLEQKPKQKKKAEGGK